MTSHLPKKRHNWKNWRNHLMKRWKGSLRQNIQIFALFHYWYFALLTIPVVDIDLFLRSELEAEKMEILDDIRKCTKSVQKSTIETTAYLRALGHSKGLDVGKFRDEVQKEMETDKKAEDHGTHFPYSKFSIHNYLGLKCTVRISYCPSISVVTLTS